MSHYIHILFLHFYCLIWVSFVPLSAVPNDLAEYSSFYQHLNEFPEYYDNELAEEPTELQEYEYINPLPKRSKVALSIPYIRFLELLSESLSPRVARTFNSFTDNRPQRFIGTRGKRLKPQEELSEIKQNDDSDKYLQSARNYLDTHSNSNTDGRSKRSIVSKDGEEFQDVATDETQLDKVKKGVSKMYLKMKGKKDPAEEQDIPKNLKASQSKTFWGARGKKNVDTSSEIDKPKNPNLFSKSYDQGFHLQPKLFWSLNENFPYEGNFKDISKRDTNQVSPSAIFWPVRGKKQTTISTPSNTFWGARGKKDVLDPDRYSSLIHFIQKNDPASNTYWGTRGKKDTNSPNARDVFWGARGKKDPNAPNARDVFWGARGKKGTNIPNARDVFWGPRGKRYSLHDVDTSQNFWTFKPRRHLLDTDNSQLLWAIKGKKASSLPKQNFSRLVLSRNTATPKTGFWGVRGKKYKISTNPSAAFWGVRGKKEDTNDNENDVFWEAKEHNMYSLPLQLTQYTE